MSVENLTRVAVDREEDMLLDEISQIDITPGGEASFFCGIDCGSTQTRSVLTPKNLVVQEDGDIEEWFKRYIVIPSLSKIAPKNLSLRTRSNRLYDNLDSIFSINGDPEVRLVRGSRVNDVEAADQELVASSKKVTSDILLFNIVDAIGYNLALFYTKIGKPIPSNVSIDLIVALPPDDMLERDIGGLRGKLENFTWSIPMKMLGDVEITVTAFAAYPEPFAQVQAYYCLADEEVPEEVLLLESGGRNSSPVILLDGAPVGFGLKSIEQSGSMLLDRIGRAYIEEYGGKAPGRRLLEQAVRTGNMKFGNASRDITGIIKTCKDAVAMDLFQKLQSDIISKQTTVNFESLNAVLLSGRVYREGEYGYSVAAKLESLIKAVSPATQVKIIDENRIPEGLVLLYLNDKILAG